MIKVSMLFELQKVLDEELECKNDLKRLTRNVQELQKKVENEEKGYLLAKAKWNKKQTDLEDLSMQLATFEEDRKKYEKELYSPKNSNPKFLKDMENKITEIKRNIDAHEEKILQMMEDAETLKKDAEKKKSTLEKIQQTFQEHSQILESTKQESKILLETLSQKKEKIENQLSEEEMEIFQKAYLLQNKAVALVTMPDACCSACKFQVPHQVADAGRKNPNELYYCENCRRILFFNA